MKANGTLFLGKTKPLVSTTSSGEFQLQLFAIDRISHNPPMAEAYRITWVGAGAKEFWSRYAADLVPGQPLRVCLSRMRAHQAPRLGAEIHAVVDAMGLMPRANQSATTEAA